VGRLQPTLTFGYNRYTSWANSSAAERPPHTGQVRGSRPSKQLPFGNQYGWWVLKTSVWDKETKRQRQVYLAYVGTKRTITESRAKEIAQAVSEKLGRKVTVEDLKRVKRLRIVAE
jgi:hypothetical protein